MNHNSQPQSLAEWADAYVCGALEPEAREQFELRLADDQAAREAVADAVALLTTAYAALEPAAAVATRRTWLEQTEWIISFGGAGLLALLLIVGVQSGGDQTADENRVDAFAADELAIIWGDLLTEDEGAANEPSVEEFLTGLDESEMQLADSPDWMLAAVGELTERDDMDHERDMENR